MTLLYDDGAEAPRVSFVDLNGNEVTLTGGLIASELAEVRPTVPSDPSTDTEFTIDLPAVEDTESISFADEWGTEDLALFEDLEALRSQNQAQQQQLEGFDIDGPDIFNMQDVAFVSPASASLSLPSSSSGENLSFSAHESAAEIGADEDTALIVEDLDWFIGMGDYTDLVIDDPLFMIEDL